MKSFLEHVAADLLNKHGGDLSRLTVVFPNKRASLFLNAHLSHLAGHPIWSPHYMTISDLFTQMSTRTVADPIKLVCELHRSFTAQTGIDETLDHFYGWGQLLLADYDDLDKSMADADRVLANLRDLHEMDTTDYLTEEQKEAIRRFFSTFSPDHNSMLRERFLRLWSHMADVYHDFNDRLSRQRIAYEGALYREVVESTGLRQGWPPQGLTQELARQTFVFVGFNVLQEVERRLFSWMKREGKARFYWDFDEYYKESDAGTFIAENLATFPNELDRGDASIYQCFAQPKSIAVVSAPTENIQARYVAQWLKQLPGPNSTLPSSPFPDTAIVLCDEKLLPTVIHCLPEEVDHVNVTTGYPLGQTPVASLIATLFALRTQGYQPSRERYRLRQVNAVLRHPYIARLSPQVDEMQRWLNEQKIYYPKPEQLCADETTTLLFSPLENATPDEAEKGGTNAALLQWMCDVVQDVAAGADAAAGRDDTPVPDPSAFNIQAEALFRAYTLLNRLLALVREGDLPVDTITLQRLLTQLMQTTTIPFHGEPAEGLQVMGVLETRCLDFRHVLLLSAGEGNMPKGVSDTSFIPYSLRKAYGLTTADHKVAIYSYYFHRLLQRAGDVTIIYNNSTADGRTGEMSRFVLQLMVEDHHHHITTKTLQAAQTFAPFMPKPVERTAEMQQKLTERFSATHASLLTPQAPLLTPTAINRYLRCPLLFYYTYVHDLREPDVTDDDTIDNRLFGNIFHEAARIVYTQLMEKNPQVTAPDIDLMLRKRVDIEMAVDQAIRQELFRLSTPTSQPDHMPDLSGLQIINRAVIIHYLRQLLSIDRKIAPFTIEGLEADVAMPLQTASMQTIVGGRIDRLDRIVKDGREQIRVIDYKTGSHVPTPLAGVEAIFEQEQLKNHSDYYLQTFLYSIIVGRGHKGTAVSPALLFIQHSGADDYSPVLKFGKEYIADVAPYEETFMEQLTETVDEMFATDTPFMPTTDRTRCTNCPYHMLCH